MLSGTAFCTMKFSINYTEQNLLRFDSSVSFGHTYFTV